MKIWLGILAAYVILALGSAILTPGPVLLQDGMENLAPGGAAILGTDPLGRSVLELVVRGARLALLVGILGGGLAVLLGTLFGLAAGWWRGPVDSAALWFSGAVAAIPGILLVLTLGFMLGGGLAALLLGIGMASWVGVFRLVRAEVRRMRNESHVLAARALGAGSIHILHRHLLPRVLPLVLVQFTLHFVFAVKAEVLLSFLGVGISGAASWGGMIADAWAFNDLGHGRWWRLTAATLAMAGLVLAVQRVADDLRDRLETERRALG